MKKLILLLTCLCFISSAARATVFSFQTADQGWWSNGVSNSTSNTNYITGFFDGSEYRSFFSFDLSSLNLAGYQVNSVSLSIPNPGIGSDRWVLLNQVTTPFNQLTQGGSPNASIFADLGDGAYASFFVGTGEDPVVRTLSNIGMFSSFFNDLLAAQGGYFSLGMSLDATNGYIFGGTEFPVTLNIDATQLPEAALSALAGLL